MILKKTFLGLLLITFLGGCAQSTAFLGPAYTLGTSGNIYQAGLSYTSNIAISSYTGKSTQENIKDLLKSKKEDSELQKLVKKRIIETRKKLDLPN